MPVNPEINEKLLQEMYKIYSQAEQKILENVTKRVKRGITEQGANEQKLKDLQELKNEIAKIANDSNGLAKINAKKSIFNAYGLPDSVMNDVVPEHVQRMILETNNLIDGTSFQILRNTQDAYRQVIAETSTSVLAGSETRVQAAQSALNKFSAKGITGFVDRIGRNWDIASYVEMATRTATSRAALQGHVDRQTAIGNDLIMVSSFGATCPICAPWSGKVLSISGKDPRYPSLDLAKSSGLFHPNCKHTITAYFEGMDYVEPERAYNPDLYDAIQKQRYHERQIRKWKRVEAVALTPEAKARAARKVSAWQEVQRKHVGAWNLRRKYARESIKNRIGDASKVRELILEPLSVAKPVKATESVTEMYKKLIGPNPSKDFKALGTTSKSYAKWLKEQVDIASSSATKPTKPAKDFDPLLYREITSKSDPLIQAHTDFIENLPEDEKSALVTYTGGAYSDMNDALRRGKVEGSQYQKQIEGCHRAFSSPSNPGVSEAIKVYRHAGSDCIKYMFGEGDKPNYELNSRVNDILRAYDGDDKNIKKQLDELKKEIVRSTCTEKGFMSTSWEDSHFVHDQGIEFQIYISEGYKDGLFVENISNFRSEREFLINSNQTLRVMDVEVGERPRGTQLILHLMLE